MDEYAEIYERIRRENAAWKDWMRERDFARNHQTDAAIAWAIARVEDYIRTAQE